MIDSRLLSLTAAIFIKFSCNTEELPKSGGNNAVADAKKASENTSSDAQILDPLPAVTTTTLPPQGNGSNDGSTNSTDTDTDTSTTPDTEDSFKLTMVLYSANVDNSAKSQALEFLVDTKNDDIKSNDVYETWTPLNSGNTTTMTVTCYDKSNCKIAVRKAGNSAVTSANPAYFMGVYDSKYLYLGFEPGGNGTDYHDVDDIIIRMHFEPNAHGVSSKVQVDNLRMDGSPCTIYDWINDSGCGA